MRWLLLPAAVLAAAAASCSSTPPAPLVVLISIDTLRADHLGTYGYSRPVSPNIDGLALDSLVFDQAFAHAPSTLPSHASLLTSLLPQQHGASHARKTSLAGDLPTLASEFSSSGWLTASFNGGGQLSSDFGLDRGFERYESLPRSEDRMEEVVSRGLEWLDGEPDRPTFLFLHTYEVHAPWAPLEQDLERFLTHPEQERPQQRVSKVEGPTDAQLSWYIDRYDAEIFSTDRAIGRLVQELRRRGRWSATTLVLTSDHGEEFGERGHLGRHAHTLFDELLRVPLLLRHPGGPIGRSEQLVGLVDVAPTLLALHGIAPPQSWRGRPLLDPGPPRREPLVAYRDTATRTPEAAVRTLHWKRIGSTLFDLQRDPDERFDVSGQHPDVSRKLDDVLSGVAHDGPTAPSADLSATTRRQLQSLGYVP